MVGFVNVAIGWMDVQEYEVTQMKNFAPRWFSTPLDQRGDFSGGIILEKACHKSVRHTVFGVK